MSAIYDNGLIKPAIGTYYNYVDVNNSQHLRKMMLDYYREKTQKWLESDYYSITNCFKVSNNKVIRNKNCSNSDKSINNQKDTKKIAEYIYEKIYKKRLIKKILLKYTKIYQVNWYDLKLEKQDLKKLIEKIIFKKIK